MSKVISIILIVMGFALAISSQIISIVLDNTDDQEIEIGPCYDDHYNKIIGQECEVVKPSSLDNTIYVLLCFGLILIGSGYILLASDMMYDASKLGRRILELN